MARWLVKSEPAKYSWDDLVRDGRTEWDGVRNPMAQGHLKAMRNGDLVFYYHSNEGKDIVGIAEVVKESYPDDTDPKGRSLMVDLKAVKPFPTPVTLSAIKSDGRFATIPLVTNSRLSVQPVPDEAWDAICKLGGL
ncbi:MAG: EVE domain-containing protein [Dehalococcoidia bacterium]|nr:EVE domain-containing protein [Dehalococcoidia bacterium]